MREIKSIILFRLKLMLKTPVTLIFLFVMPTIFSLIFGSLSSGEQVETEIPVVQSEGKYAEELIHLLEQNDEYVWQQESLETARQLVADREVIAAVVIPEDVEERLIEKDALFDVIVNQKTEQYLVLSPYLEGISQSVHQIFHDIEQVDVTEVNDEAFEQIVQDLVSEQIIAVESGPLEDNNEKEVNTLPIGFTIMFMMFALGNAASSIHVEREEKTWQRLMVSPISSFQVLSGYLLSYFILGWLQLGTLMIVMKLVFDVDWGNLLYLIPFASLTILLIVGYAIMMASLMKTRKQTEITNSIIIVSTCMLGGVYWPLEIVPPFMQTLSKFVPQAWMISGFENIMKGDIMLSNLNMDTLILSAITIVFLTIGIVKIRKITH